MDNKCQVCGYNVGDGVLILIVDKANQYGYNGKKICLLCAAMYEAFNGDCPSLRQEQLSYVKENKLLAAQKDRIMNTEKRKWPFS